VLFPDDRGRDILFIGCNPSTGEKTYFDHEEHKLLRSWKYAKSKKDCRDRLVAIEQKSRTISKFFKKFIKIKEEFSLLGLREISWGHIDLFFYRDTSQDHFKKFIMGDSKKGILNEFGEKQLSIAVDLINYISPKLIVVANSFASDMLSKKLNISDSQFNEDTGYHIITINGKDTIIFFSSMLTGRRALDNRSFERLKWHIRQALRVGDK